MTSKLVDKPNLTAHYYAKSLLDTDVFITSCSKLKRIVVIFRGTDGVKDWLTNARIIQVKFGNEETNMKWSEPPGSSAKVHRGFNQAFFSDGIPEKINKVIDDILANHPDYQILVTGHSLGAALSILCGVYLSLQRPTTEITVENFGSPRVGNDHFKNWANAIPNLVIWRFVQGNDLVTHVPLALMNYSHVGHLFHLCKDSKVYYLQDGDSSLHYIAAPKCICDGKFT